MSRRREGGGLRGRRETSRDWREMRSGWALAAGAGGSNSEMSVTARPACVGGRRGRVKGTDGRAGVLGLCIVLPVDFNG